MGVSISAVPVSPPLNVTATNERTFVKRLLRHPARRIAPSEVRIHPIYQTNISPSPFITLTHAENTH